jgi:hypothetical protein
MVYNANESVISRESHGPMTTQGQKYYQSNDKIIGSSHLGSDSDEFDSAGLRS